MLYPTPDHRQEKVAHPRLELLNAYFRVNGPTTRTLFHHWMESGTASTADLWKELGNDLVRRPGRQPAPQPAPRRSWTK